MPDELSFGGDRPDHTRLPDWLLVGGAEVFECKLVQMGSRAIVGRSIDYSTADFRVPIRVVGVPDEHGHGGVTLNMPVLDPTQFSVDNQVALSGVNPHHRCLGAAVGCSSGEDCEVRTSSEPTDLFVERALPAGLVGHRSWVR